MEKGPQLRAETGSKHLPGRAQALPSSPLPTQTAAGAKAA